MNWKISEGILNNSPSMLPQSPEAINSSFATEHFKKEKAENITSCTTAGKKKLEGQGTKGHIYLNYNYLFF